ncbi:S24 family peptidase [Paraburkholderia fungorum]|uniref:S24 family peptidase n=1 Tax=Paraburkholderia fungorum TaxID=134537 RepID=UPI0038BBCC65
MTERYLSFPMPNNDMRPRIKAGEAVIYDTQGGAEPGDDVVIELVDGGFIVRELIARTDDGFRLKSYAPSAVGALPTARVAAVYPVVARARPAFMKEIEANQGVQS